MKDRYKMVTLEFHGGEVEFHYDEPEECEDFFSWVIFLLNKGVSIDLHPWSYFPNGFDKDMKEYRQNEVQAKDNV